MNSLHTRGESSSFWTKLITGKILPFGHSYGHQPTLGHQDPSRAEAQCTRISQHIEVVGFTSKNINEYISKAFTDSKKERSVFMNTWLGILIFTLPCTFPSTVP